MVVSLPKPEQSQAGLDDCSRGVGELQTVHINLPGLRVQHLRDADKFPTLRYHYDFLREVTTRLVCGLSGFRDCFAPKYFQQKVRIFLLEYSVETRHQGPLNLDLPGHSALLTYCTVLLSANVKLISWFRFSVISIYYYLIFYI